LKRLSVLLAVAAVLTAACGNADIEAASTTTSQPAATTTNTTTTTVPATTTVVDQIAGVWARVPHDETVFGSEGWPTMESVAAGGPGLVAVGYDSSDDDIDAAVWISVDGVTWSRVPHDETVFGGEGKQIMFSVAAGGPGVVAVGYDGFEAAVWTSVDGVTWSRVPHDEMVFGDPPQGMVSVTAGGPGLVAVGYDESGDYSDAAVWTSVDGLTWSRVPNDETIFGGEDGRQTMSSVVATDSGLVAVGYDDGIAAVWTSPDGLAWTQVPNDETIFGGSSMKSVVVGGPGLVAVGTSGGHAAVWYWTPNQ